MTSVVSGVIQESTSETRRLKPVSEITIPSWDGVFVSREMFQIKTRSGVDVPIGHIGENFQKWFLSGEGLLETSVEEHRLQYASLVEESTDQEILNDLGCEETVSLSVVTLYYLMELFKGQRMVSDGHSNVFFVPDQSGIVRAVRLFQFGRAGWGLCADSIDSNHRCIRGSRVFYRLV